MPLSPTAFLATLMAAALAAGDVNPDAQHACSPIQGGQDACGPNGSEGWLNTGIGGGGWEPPYLDINKLVHITLKDYYQGVGKPCQKYNEYFQSAGKKYNIDPAILAFLAMQESTCNADEGGPTPGLMQCDSGNCQNGKSSCQYPLQDQVDCGAWVLRSGLDRAGGNAVRALGAYNGWFTAADQWGYNGGKGLTLSYPCSDEGKSNGVPQNLDYLHQTLNGWFQGLDIYGKDSHLGGKYNCQQNCNDGLC